MKYLPFGDIIYDVIRERIEKKEKKGEPADRRARGSRFLGIAQKKKEKKKMAQESCFKELRNKIKK